MIHTFNMSSDENMIQVETLTSNEKTLDNLYSDSEYAIIVYAINEYGISDASNMIVIST